MDTSPKTVQSWQVNILITLLLLVVTLLAFQAVDRRAKMPEWEYKVGVQPDATLQETINKLGAEGWEMVFARRVAPEVNGQPYMYEMIFRRPLSLNPRP